MFSLSLSNVSHQWTLQGVFIGGVTPPMYNYSFAPLQRSCFRNIPGRIRDLQIPAYVRYSSERPTTPGGPLRPDRRRPWGPTDHFSSGRLWRPVFAMSSSSNPRTHETGISALALDISFVAPDVLSSCSFGDRPEGGVPNTLYRTETPRSKYAQSVSMQSHISLVYVGT